MAPIGMLFANKNMSIWFTFFKGRFLQAFGKMFPSRHVSFYDGGSLFTSSLSTEADLLGRMAFLEGKDPKDAFSVILEDNTIFGIFTFQRHVSSFVL